MATRCDRFYGGRFALMQPQGRGYRSGLDALLLAATLPATATGRLADGTARAAAGLGDGTFGHVLTNPPYHPHDHRISPDPLRAAAMSAADGDFLARWVRACAALLSHGGRFATIVRTDALPTLLAACDGRIGALRLLAIHARAD